jgi:hypothetical protein
MSAMHEVGIASKSSIYVPIRIELPFFKAFLLAFLILGEQNR